MKITCIGRGTIGKALSLFNGFEVISHTDEIDMGGDMIVNCAGIVGDAKCDNYKDVVNANVEHAVALSNIQRPIIQFSSAGVYAKQYCKTSTDKLKEGDPVYPHNLYCASKILMENALAKYANTYILRIPFVEVEGLGERYKNYQWVQDGYCSIVTPETIASVIKRILKKHLKSGVYNIRSKEVYFPSFVNNYLDTPLEIRYDPPGKSSTANVVLNVDKALETGLL